MAGGNEANRKLQTKSQSQTRRHQAKRRRRRESDAGSLELMAVDHGTLTGRLLGDRDRIQERHHRAQLSADDLDFLTALLVAELVHGLATILVVLVDEAFGELAG